MANILDFLGTSTQTNKDYLGENPYYLGGMQLLKLGMQPIDGGTRGSPVSTTSQFLAPFLSSLLGGTLMSYGKRNATKEQFSDMAQNPLLKDFRDTSVAPITPMLDQPAYDPSLPREYPYADPTNMPKGWSSVVGKNDLETQGIAEKMRLDDEQNKKKFRFDLINKLAGDNPAASIAAAKALGIDLGEIGPILQGKTLRPDDEAAVANALGLTGEGGRSPEQLRIITAAMEAARRREGQDTRLSGENLIPPSKDTKTAMGNAIKVKEIGNRYLTKLDELAVKDPGILERNISKVLPQTEIGKLQKDLSLFAVQLRNARENGIMTDTDYDRYMGYLSITPLDSIASVQGRFKELLEVADISAIATLTAAKAGQENISGYEKLFGKIVPDRIETQDSPNSHAGMKQQVNKVTGETRWVPK